MGKRKMKGKGSAASCQSGDECGKGKYEMKVERMMEKKAQESELVARKQMRKNPHLSIGVNCSQYLNNYVTW